MDKPTALIVEDEYDISIIFSRALGGAGYEVEIIRAGDTALTWLAAQVPDLVLLDLHLPRVPGTEILEHIRADARFDNTHVVIVTAYPRMAKDLRDLADWILMKPVNFGHLRALMSGIRRGELGRAVGDTGEDDG